MKVKKQKKRVASIRMPVYWCEIKCQWHGSELVFKYFDNGNEVKRVTLVINSPSDADYIEERIADIRKNWRAQLGVTTAT